MKKKSVIFKTLFILSCAFGLFLTASTSSSFAIFISYYTTQSNILCLIVMIMTLTWILVGKGTNPRVFRLLKSLATVCILVTFLIFHFLLRPNMGPDMENVSHGLGNIMVHYVTPIWFFADYLLFDVKGTCRVSDPLLYALFPLYYFVFANVRAVTGELYQYGTSITQFPYPFLDYEVLGIFGVSAAVMVITVAVLFLGALFVGFDQVMKKPQQRYHTHLYGTISHKPIERAADRSVESPRPSHQTVEIKEAEETEKSLLPPS
ncbi:MAG: hypothetical protein A2Y16_05890 [Tenericutes bacterium GWF2_57_13]|nr:MAG: hypothetical protein A2Y16_05890 [Tenericutes bacterium GWF2_57_13]